MCVRLGSGGSLPRPECLAGRNVGRGRQQRGWGQTAPPHMLTALNCRRRCVTRSPPAGPRLQLPPLLLQGPQLPLRLARDPRRPGRLGDPPVCRAGE